MCPSFHVLTALDEPIQTGLFATTVGSFIIAVFPNLQPASSDQSAAALQLITQQLGQISQQLASPGSAPSFAIPNITSPVPFTVSSTAIQVNILWVLSFVLSLFCALLATLVQQWSRTYIADTQRRGAPRSRGPIHAYLRVGIDRFGFNYVVDAIITILHISVSLFLAGLLVFLFSLNSTVANTALAIMSTLLLGYLMLTFLPLLTHDCPYRTPLTPVFRPPHKVMLAGALRILHLTSPVELYLYSPAKNVWNATYHYLLRAGKGRQHILALCSQAEPLAKALLRPTYVLQQMASSLDENDEIYEYISSVPSYLSHLQWVDSDLEKSVPRDKFHPVIDKLLSSFDSRRNPAFTLTPIKTDQIVQLCSMAIHSSSERKDTGFILPSNGKYPVTKVTVSQPVMDQEAAGHWYELVDDTSNPVVSFLAFCVSSSLFILDLGSLTSRSLNTIDNLNAFREKSFFWTIWVQGDPLLKSLKQSPRSHKDIYRLLLFIRAVLHHATLPENPVSAHESIWLPILDDFRNRVVKLDYPHSFPDDALVVVWRVLSLIGRDDLLPCGAAGLPAGTPRLDYASVFEQYPVLGGTLRSLVSTVTPSMHQISHKVSAPALLQRPTFWNEHEAPIKSPSLRLSVLTL
jgi:hypothetical protein